MEAIIILPPLPHAERHGSIHGHCKCRRHNRLPFLAALAAFTLSCRASLSLVADQKDVTDQSQDTRRRSEKDEGLITTRRTNLLIRF